VIWEMLGKRSAAPARDGPEDAGGQAAMG
jgi:hypothetical protein